MQRGRGAGVDDLSFENESDRRRKTHPTPPADSEDMAEKPEETRPRCQSARRRRIATPWTRVPLLGRLG